MKKELYIDISNEAAGGSLYRLTDDGGGVQFRYEHSTYNSDTDELQVFQDLYPDFAAFWRMISKDPQWHFLHPLYIHPEQRAFIQQQLQGVDWAISGDGKWQESHRRQWKKVLNDPGNYYKGPA